MAREMMFGTRESFSYTECARCGCVQIDDVPEDLTRFYPDSYYSLAPKMVRPFKRYLRKSRDAQLLGRTSLVGALAVKVLGKPSYYSWFNGLGLRADAHILDVGAGAGDLVFQMTDAGYSNVSGIDPNIGGDIDLLNGAKLRKCGLADVNGEFDLVMLHHSFEHMPDPRGELNHVRRLLVPNGHAIIRIPIAGTHAWCAYREDWVQLDAPRHLTLHTQTSMALLAAEAGMRIRAIVFDSTDIQFWGSELYRKDIAFFECMKPGRMRPPMKRHKLRALREQAKTLNATEQGDQAIFYLSPESTERNP